MLYKNYKIQNMNKSLIILIFFLSVLNSYSQQRNCGTMQYFEYQKLQNPNLEDKMLQNEISLQSWIQNQALSKSINAFSVSS